MRQMKTEIGREISQTVVVGRWGERNSTVVVYAAIVLLVLVNFLFTVFYCFISF